METNLTDENFVQEIQSTDKLVLIDFFADWCEPCRMLAPVLEKVAEDLKERIILKKANLDHVPQVAGNFGIDSIPVVVAFKNGKPVSGFKGFAPEMAVKDWLSKILEEKSEDESEKIKAMIDRYENYAAASGIRLNPDKKIVEGLMKGLLQNEKKYGKKYCPCRRVTGDEGEDAKKVCPCAFHKDEVEKDGHCLCNLFFK